MASCEPKVDQVVQGAAELNISAPPAACQVSKPAKSGGKKENESAKILLKTAKVA